MQQWPRQIMHYTPEEVQEFCVNDDEWQSFRKSLKGVPTWEKLDKLELWLMAYRSRGRRTQVQIDNYLNALRRGGQLDLGNHVQR